MTVHQGMTLLNEYHHPDLVHSLELPSLFPRTVSVANDGREPISTLAERQCCSRPPRLLSKLSKKRSIRSLTPDHSHDVRGSPFYSVKRMKEYLPLLLDRPSSSDRKTSVKGLSLELSDPASKESPGLATVQRSNDYQFESTRSKALLSPIKFTTQDDTSSAGLRTTDSSQSPKLDCCVCLGESPICGKHSAEQTQSKPTLLPNLSHRSLCRQLSYGETLKTPERRSLHRTTASRELRGKAGLLAEEDDRSSSIRDTLKTSAVEPYFSELLRSKSSCSLNLTEDEDKIEEAVSLSGCTSIAYDR